MNNNPRFIFFGTPEPAVIVLEELAKVGLYPTHIVTNPDRPKGRGLVTQPSPAKEWGRAHNIPVLSPEILDTDFENTIKEASPDVCIVVAYGKILKQELLDIPSKGFLNVHPSLLPLHRGATPIQSSLLAGDTETGVSIIELDDKMDHGPLVAQEFVMLKGDETSLELHQKLFSLGGILLGEILSEWVSGNIDSQEQEHELATYSKKIKKEDGEIKEGNSDELKWRKYRAYSGWPGVYYFQEGKRVKITSASIEKGKFIIKRIIPEGKKEQDYL